MGVATWEYFFPPNIRVPRETNMPVHSKRVLRAIFTCVVCREAADRRSHGSTKSIRVVRWWSVVRKVHKWLTITFVVTTMMGAPSRSSL